MFETLDADVLLDERDDSSDDDWVRAAEYLQYAWYRNPDAARATPAVVDMRKAAFKRTFEASGGHHDLAATVSDDFDLICRRALLGVELPFISALEQAYEAHRFPI
ncbi:MAG TPA: hypothetical protein VFE51_16005 [Verrucomicrobiae bacterium]|nr:hypothetical protein [Verrucomicrobiae bacterium]